MASGHDIGAAGRGLSRGIRTGILFQRGYDDAQREKRRRRALEAWEEAGAAPEEVTVGTVRPGDEFVGPHADPTKAVPPRIGKRKMLKWDKYYADKMAAASVMGPEAQAAAMAALEAQKYQLMQGLTAQAGLAMRQNQGHVALDAIEAATGLGFPGEDFGFNVDANGVLRSKNGTVVDDSMLAEALGMMRNPLVWERQKAEIAESLASRDFLESRTGANRAAVSAARANATSQEPLDAKEWQTYQTDLHDYNTGLVDTDRLAQRYGRLFDTEDKFAGVLSFFTDDKLAPAIMGDWNRLATGLSGRGQKSIAQASDQALQLLAWAHRERNEKGFGPDAVKHAWVDGNLVLDYDGQRMVLDNIDGGWFMSMLELADESRVGKSHYIPNYEDKREGTASSRLSVREGQWPKRIAGR